MASNNIDDEKPNLRPTKFVDANGKSLGTCYCLNQSWGGASIQAAWNKPINRRRSLLFDKPGLFGIKQPFVAYSLHKQKRWELLDDIQHCIAYSSDSSSDDELVIESQSNRRGKRDHSIPTLPHDAYHIEVERFSSERFRKEPQRPLALRLNADTNKLQRQNDNSRADSDITYHVHISSRRKPIPSVRTNHRARRMT